MSRVEDDREAARVEARQVEQRRLDDAQRTKKATENAKFSRLVGEQKQAAQVHQQRSAAKSAIEHLLETAETTDAEGVLLGDRVEHGEHLDRLARSARGQSALGDATQGRSRDEGAQADGRQRASTRGSAAAAAGQQADHSSSSRSAEGRRADARTGRDRAEQRRADADASSSRRAPVGKVGGKESELKADTENGGQQGQGGKDPKDASAMGASLRFNPALMAPVPVAQQKSTSGSERLRKVANELAQKIVERVRVGTNAMGRAEFQVDLRQDVLAGLSVKVSAQNGKIRAVFSGSDKEVLKLVEQQVEVLKGALAGRGLTLEDVKIEVRA
jgi:hypothetical protein